MKTDHVFDTIIIGAGAAGVGLGALFEKMGMQNYLILEQDTIGSSFLQWPEYTRFISPSFSGNAFGAIDLNAITPDTSPAHTLKTEHPTGSGYARYLALVARHFKVKIREGVTVTTITKSADLFTLETAGATLHARTIVWAGGEFQYPLLPSIPGVELGVHSSQVSDITGDRVTIIGGYESGMDIAKEALERGKDVTIIDAAMPWAATSSDSSISISPYTQERIRSFAGSEQLTLLGSTRVTAITKESAGYSLTTDTGMTIHADEPPILATGFKNLPPGIADLFSETASGAIALTLDDESTITPGCYLIGPKVQHNAAIFCFIYKYRQRFAVVANAISTQLALGLEIPPDYQKPGMYLRDLSACGEECAC